jgi:hypothetical protein
MKTSPSDDEIIAFVEAILSNKKRATITDNKKIVKIRDVRETATTVNSVRSEIVLE